MNLIDTPNIDSLILGLRDRDGKYYTCIRNSLKKLEKLHMILYVIDYNKNRISPTAKENIKKIQKLLDD